MLTMSSSEIPPKKDSHDKLFAKKSEIKSLCNSNYVNLPNMDLRLPKKVETLSFTLIKHRITQSKFQYFNYYFIANVVIQ